MPPLYEFGDVRVDPVAFRVLKAGQPVSVEPKAFEVLLYLVQNPGRLVEKKELLEQVWPNTVVTESAMTRVIADLRRALGDTAREAHYIETVPTKGYRFIATVRRVSGEETLTPAGGARPPLRIASRAAVAAGLALGLVLLLLAVRATRRRPAPAAAPAASLHSQQVTDSPGLDLFPTFSPDGAQIAYSSDKGGGFEIFIRQLAPGGRDIQITSDGQENIQPAWSPTGQEIAFTSRGRQGIWLVPALGGVPRRLTDFGSHPSWSPDGKTIAFQSTLLGDVWTGAPAALSPSSLFTVAVIGGTPVALTRPGSPPGGHGAPCFSPDGAWIAFSTFGDRLSELWRVSRDGQTLDRVTRTGPDLRAIFFEPAFSPRGDWLYVAASESRRNSVLERFRVPSKPGEEWGDSEQVGVAATVAIRHPVVRPDGSGIAYSSLSKRGDIASLPIDPATSLPSGPPVFLTRKSGRRSTVPVFSPDGSRIAFVSHSLGSPSQIWLMDPNGDHTEPATMSPEPANSPSWFPDGKGVTYLSTRAGSTALFSVDLSSRAETKIREMPKSSICAALSPDGRQIAFAADSEGARCAWIVPIEGGEPRRVAAGPDSVGFPFWSPDGTHLATDVRRKGENLLVEIPVAGGPQRILLRQAGESWPHSFSPDGQRIVYAGQRAGRWNLYWVSVQGGPERQLTSYATPAFRPPLPLVVSSREPDRLRVRRGDRQRLADGPDPLSQG